LQPKKVAAKNIAAAKKKLQPKKIIAAKKDINKETETNLSF